MFREIEKQMLPGLINFFETALIESPVIVKKLALEMPHNMSISRQLDKRIVDANSLLIGFCDYHESIQKPTKEQIRKVLDGLKNYREEFCGGMNYESKT